MKITTAPLPPFAPIPKPENHPAIYRGRNTGALYITSRDGYAVHLVNGGRIEIVRNPEMPDQVPNRFERMPDGFTITFTQGD